MYGGSQAVGNATQVVIISCGVVSPCKKVTLQLFGVYLYIFRRRHIFTTNDLKLTESFYIIIADGPVQLGRCGVEGSFGHTSIRHTGSVHIT